MNSLYTDVALSFFLIIGERARVSARKKNKQSFNSPLFLFLSCLLGRLLRKTRGSVNIGYSGN